MIASPIWKMNSLDCVSSSSRSFTTSQRVEGIVSLFEEEDDDKPDHRQHRPLVRRSEPPNQPRSTWSTSSSSSSSYKRNAVSQPLPHNGQVVDDDDATLTEPPLSLYCDGATTTTTGLGSSSECNYHLVGAFFDIPFHNVSYGNSQNGRVGGGGHVAATTRHAQVQPPQPAVAAMIGPTSNQSTPIQLSPLTPATTGMEKEYDRDTWRMYQRIKSARQLEQPQHRSSSSSITSPQGLIPPPPQPMASAAGDAAAAGFLARSSLESGGYGYASSATHSISPLYYNSHNHEDHDYIDEDHDDDAGHEEIFEMDLDS